MPNTAGVETRDMTPWAARLSAMGARVGRAVDVLFGRDFGPGAPLAPRTAPDSPEQTQGPRQYQYPVSANLTPSPRREQPGLTPFEQLRNLAALYDVAALAIACRIEELQGLELSFVAKDKKQQSARQADCDELADFWSQPDGLNYFPVWLGMLLYDLFTVDAMTLYKHPDVAGRLLHLEVVDGATIKPLLDNRGRTLAYQQVLYGYPFSEYKRPDTDAPDEQFPVYGTHQLVYNPRWTRAFTPYGFPPTEWIILRVNQALRKQTFDLSYFTEGNIPDMIVSPPSDVSPDQVSAFEDNFNATLQGNDANRRRIHFWPWAKPDVKELRQFSYDTTLDYWMLRVTCAAYATPPTELGFTDDANRATSEMQEAINERRGLRPLTKWLKDTVFDPLSLEYGLSADMQRGAAVSLPGRPTRRKQSRFWGLEAQWNYGERDDALQKAQENEIYLRNYVVSPAEVRTLEFGHQLDGPPPTPPAAPPASGGFPFGAAAPGVALAKADWGPEPDWETRLKREQAAQKIFAQAYGEQAERIKAVIKKAGPDPQAIQLALSAAFGEEAPKIIQLLLPFFDDVASAAAQEGASQLTIGVDWDKVNPAVLRVARARAEAFADKASEVSQQQTQEIVADWISTGGTMPDLINRVARVWQGPRPDVAAVDEVTGLFAEGNITAWKASETVKGYRFRTARDSKVCPICRPLDGNVYPLDDEQHRPSMHPRCRCGITPVVKTPEEMRNL